MKPTVYLPLLGIAALAACSGSIDAPANPIPPVVPYTTFLAQGDSATIAARLDAFRAALGGALNAPNAAPANSGRREINWDGVPAALTNVDTFPASFFNANSKRGVVYVTPGTGLRVDSSAFSSLNAALGDQFKAFSPKKLFVAVGSKHVEVDFKRAGTDSAGVVTGFGVVFADVDRAGSTSVDYLDAAGVVLAHVEAPAQSGARGFSFVGAVFDSPVVARVQIDAGDGAIGANVLDVSAGGTADLVAMDDFIYGEPQAPAAPAATVQVGNTFFRSAHNGTSNEAVDTVAVGGTVTWSWVAAGSHSIQSTGLPPAVFRNSVVMSGAASSYAVTFKRAGTYPYQCGVHGAAMSGRIVVR